MLHVTFLVSLAGNLIPELKAQSSVQGHPWVQVESETTQDFIKLSKRKEKKEKETKSYQNIRLNVKDICLTFVVTRDPILQLNVTGWWVDPGSGDLPLSKCLRAQTLLRCPVGVWSEPPPPSTVETLPCWWPGLRCFPGFKATGGCLNHR